MTPFVIFLVAGLGTFALRIVMILGAERFNSASWLQQHIALVSPAVLAAIVASAVLVSNGQAAVPNPVIVVVVGAGAYAVHRTGNVAAALAVGLPIYWLAALAGLV